MAKASRAAPTAAENERAERELNTDINAAVAGTETEIFDDATGDEPLENDGDTSLEEMGDGLEGDDLDEEGDADDAGEEEGDGEDGEDGDGDDGDGQPAEGEVEGEEGDGEDDEARPLAARDDDTGRFVPRGRVKEEADRRRAAEDREREKDERIAALAAQVDTLTQVVSGRGQQQQQPKPEAQQRPPKPDMFADPEGYEQWMIAEADRRADERVQRALGGFRQEQQEQLNERANVSLAEAANGPRSFEFHQAYGKLTSLDPKVPQNRTLASRILTAADPASELWSWWEKNGGPEYREQIAEQLAEQLGFELPAREQPAPRRGAQRGSNRQQSQEEQPRPVFRGPQRMETRSLNGARGGMRQQIDPRSLDDSDAAVMGYVFES